MKTPKKILLFCCFLGWGAAIGHAQEREEKVRKHYFSLKVDNDALAFTHFDRYYTNGIFLSYAHYLNENNRLKARLSQQIYTPERYTSDDIRFYDRPYAGVLYGELGYQHFVRERWWIQGDLLLGKIGPGSKAEDVQVWYHHLFGFPQPRGWQNQIQSGGLVNAKIQSALNVLQGNHFDLWLFSRAAVGNFDRSLGITPTIRIGDFAPGSRGFIAGEKLGASTKKEIYFQGGVDFKRVFWNATLQGTARHAGYDPATMKPVRLVNEFYGQFVLSYSRVGFTYRFSYRSQETSLSTGQLLGSLNFYYAF